MKKYFSQILFLFTLLTVSYFYNYHEIAFKRPQSIHSWRQSDCASLALNYSQNGMKFFQPETHNLTSDGGTISNACTSEIPILYYSVAQLYKVFGYHEAIFRILNTLLFFLGLFYLFRLLNYLLRDSFWAISVSILFFTSPVLVFYGNNFISNSSALAFSIAGWYYFIRFYAEGKEKYFVVSMLVFLLAATFKVTALFSLFAIGGIYLIEVFRITRLKQNSKLFKRPIQQLLLMAGVVAIVFAWVLYARYYNQKYDCTYFSTTIFPIWMLDKANVLEVFDKIRKVWLHQYYHFSVLIVLGLCSLFVAVFHKKNFKFLNLVLVIIFAEVLTYFLLQFWTFKDHDYYTIDMYILPVLLLVSACLVLKTRFNPIFTSVISKVIFAALVVFNIYYAQKINNERYNGWANNMGVLNDSYSITPYLREIGITVNDTVISIPDGSHLSLYLMNQKGWTEYQDARLNRGEPIPYNRDAEGIQKSINRGARYLIVDGIGQLYEKPYLQTFCTHLKGRYNNTLIFDLRDSKTNFNLTNRIIAERLFCDVEHLAANNTEFLGEPDSTIFRNGQTQSSDYARNGKYSCKVQKDLPYGCTIKVSDLQFGESLVTSVWRKVGNGGNLIASAPDFYSNNSEIVETIEGWEKLGIEIFISKELENKDLDFYMFNPNEEPAYFDDFEILRYKSVLE